jgi:hypothetical protein
LQKVVAGVPEVFHIGAAMFQLTKQEAMIVALLVGAILVGAVARQWRERQVSPDVATSLTRH